MEIVLILCFISLIWIECHHHQASRCPHRHCMICCQGCLDETKDLILSPSHPFIQ